MKKKYELFDVVNGFLLTVFTLICFYPLWYVIVISFSTFKGYFTDPYHIIPWSFTMDNYLSIIRDGKVLNGFWVSFKVTSIGTVISMILTVIAGYVFSKEKLPGIKYMFMFVLFTMYVSGGLVPTYLLVVGLGLKNTLWALILPMVASTFNIIIARNFFMALPSSLEESAKIDGASELTVLFRIVIPISKPVIAALTLFYAVGYWNNYMLSVLYISKRELMPVQLVIRSMLKNLEYSSKTGGQTAFHIHGLNMAAVLIGLIPILIIYPLLQKYFAKGVMIGAVKG